MLDENRFFEDFNKEIEQIEPDPSFVDRMVNLTNEEPVRMQRKFKPAYFVAVAAAVLMLIGMTNVLTTNSNLNNKITPELQASKEKESDEVKSGVIGDMNNQTEMTIDTLIEVLEKEEAIITDENGEALVLAQKEELLKKIKNADKVNVQEIDGESKKYTVSNENIEFEVVDEKYILFNKEIYEIK